MSDFFSPFTEIELQQFFLERELQHSKISHYLHEDVAQALRALTLALPESSDTVDFKAFGLKTMKNLQEMVHQLYPIAIEELGLTVALKALATELTGRVNPDNTESKKNLCISISTKFEQEPTTATSILVYRLLERLLKTLLKTTQSSIDVLLLKKTENSFLVSIELISSNSKNTNCIEDLQDILTEVNIRLRLAALKAKLELESNFINISFSQVELRESGQK